MSIYARPFEALGTTQNAVMDGTVKTITFAHAGGDKDSTVNIVIDGTQKVFYRAVTDAVDPSSSNAKPLLPGTDNTLGLPAGCASIKLIGTAGSTAYVTRGRGA
jgi:hypothetical protein